jgi:DNA-binding response OmpR family regulator
MTKRVLIADDEPNIVTSLEFLLEKAGYEVKIARTGDEALALVESFAPDAVLLDVMMPSKSGYVVCREIRENPAWRDIKIIMLTAKGRDVEIDKGFALGANAYITKPFSTKELVTIVRDLVGGGA